MLSNSCMEEVHFIEVIYYLVEYELPDCCTSVRKIVLRLGTKNVIT